MTKIGHLYINGTLITSRASCTIAFELRQHVHGGVTILDAFEDRQNSISTALSSYSEFHAHTGRMQHW
ncbi:hypothetical protein C8R48DRAFT_700183 [Suillus tomentosus]|nr:hypothetical protein C8R48DRAFT_700183 [Suillus tomentosus]